MNLPEFLNGIRILWNIDAADYLPCINYADRIRTSDAILWERFRDNPHRTFVALPDQDQARVFAIITKRNESLGHATRNEGAMK